MGRVSIVLRKLREGGGRMIRENMFFKGRINEWIGWNGMMRNYYIFMINQWGINGLFISFFE